MSQKNKHKETPTSEESLKELSKDIEFKEFEFSHIPYNRMPPPGGFNQHGFPGQNFGGFFPQPPNNNNNNNNNFPFPPINNNGNNQGVNPNQMGPPPNYIPSKNDKNVQLLNSSGPGGPQTKSVSQNSISFCLYKFTYIWEVNGRSYWAYLFNVDRVSVSGMRWLGYYWVYFGVDLRRIDSFVCYRNSCEECSKEDFLRGEDVKLDINYKKEYGRKITRTICSHTLCSLDIPEYKNDLIVEKIGYVDDKDVMTEIPCMKYRNNNYKILLEVAYNDSLDDEIKNKINEISKSSALFAYNVLNNSSSTRSNSSPLQIYENCQSSISQGLNSFDEEFTTKLREFPNWKDVFDEIEYSIKEESTHSPWLIY